MLASVLEIAVILYQYQDIIEPLLEVGSSLLENTSSVISAA